MKGFEAEQRKQVLLDSFVYRDFKPPHSLVEDIEGRLPLLPRVFDESVCKERNGRDRHRMITDVPDES